MPIRIECTTPTLEDNYIELTDHWTRADLAALFQPGQTADLARRKITACHLARGAPPNPDRQGGAAPLIDPATLYTPEGDLHPDLDLRLLHFIPAALLLAANQLATLGKTNARLSSAGAERATPTAPATPTTRTPTPP